MARLAGTYPGDWEIGAGEDIEKYLKRTSAMLKAIPRDRMISFPVADGHASYFVVSVKPPVLLHIPYGDAYRIDAAHIRGLRGEDIKRRLEQEAGLRSIFAGRDDD